jgi:hypothetical protein
MKQRTKACKMRKNDNDSRSLQIKREPRSINSKPYFQIWRFKFNVSLRGYTQLKRRNDEKSTSLRMPFTLQTKRGWELVQALLMTKIGCPNDPAPVAGLQRLKSHSTIRFFIHSLTRSTRPRRKLAGAAWQIQAEPSQSRRNLLKTSR